MKNNNKVPFFSVHYVTSVYVDYPKGRQFTEFMRKYDVINVTLTPLPDEAKAPQNPTMSNTSVLFVSISFIVLIIISLAWLVFYYIQRCRYTNAKERLSVSMII